MSNIVEVVVADKNLATMSKSVKAAGLDTVLSEKGPFTIFAPTDLAFSKLAAGRMEELLKVENSARLTDLLNLHVVGGSTIFSDLKDGQKLVTVNGKELEVKVTGDKVTINGATLQSYDSNASNGVVHSLDTVIELN